VAIRAHEITLCGLRKDLIASASPKVDADLAELLKARFVVPLHDLAGEDPSAVGTWSTLFERAKPRLTTALGPLERTWNLPADTSLVAFVVDHSAALPAIRLKPVHPARVLSEGGPWFHFVAAWAVLHFWS